MAIRDTLAVINRMQADGVISNYAIGGAVGALLYLEAASTEDVDIFLNMPASSGSALVSLAPIYEYLTGHGCEVQGQYVVIGDWPVQFLPATTSLEREALAQAAEVRVEGVKTRVMRAEHLAAIAIQTGRAKDHVRVLQFLEQRAVDRAELEGMVDRHGLLAKWQAFKEKFL